MESYGEFLSESDYQDMIQAKAIIPVVSKYELSIKRQVKYPDAVSPVPASALLGNAVAATETNWGLAKNTSFRSSSWRTARIRSSRHATMVRQSSSPSSNKPSWLRRPAPSHSWMQRLAGPLTSGPRAADGRGFTRASPRKVKLQDNSEPNGRKSASRRPRPRFEERERKCVI